MEDLEHPIGDLISVSDDLLSLNFRDGVPPTMRYEKEHKETAQHRITSAARVGFDRTTIDEIMLEAGMTRGGFYKHFPSKRALFIEVGRGPGAGGD